MSEAVAEAVVQVGVSPALEITDLEAGYGPTLIARGISMSVGRGEMVTIIGPNGSGKSTTIKAIFGLADVSGGTIRLRGEDITGERADRLIEMGIGYVPQAGNVFPTLSVRENVEMGAFTMRGRCRAAYGEGAGFVSAVEGAVEREGGAAFGRSASDAGAGKGLW